MQYIDRSLKKEHDMQIQITLSFEEGKLVVFIGQCIGFFAAKPYVTLNARLAGLSKTMSFKTAIVKDTNPTFDEVCELKYLVILKMLLIGLTANKLDSERKVQLKLCEIHMQKVPEVPYFVFH